MTWSFSSEWDHHFKAGLDRTWGWTIKSRVEQFYLETETAPENIAGKLVLDAGCGNGQLSEAISNEGATVVGLDYSTSVIEAEKHRQSPNVHFIRGDLQHPPFKPGVFDIIVSNGVIHHTPSTYETFKAMVDLVKPAGKFYLWLYSRPSSFRKGWLFYPALDAIRLVVSRLPETLQRLAVMAFAFAFLALHFVKAKVTGRKVTETWGERIVAAYDSITPHFRHYHTPVEVFGWFHNNGYSRSSLSHWDNPYGFGVVATRIPVKETPGVSYLATIQKAA